MPKVVPEYKEEAKRKIITAGIEVLGRKGYCATTMDDIAAHLGVSKGALYLYFKNKDDLVVEVVKTMHMQTLNRAIVAFPNNAPLDAWTALLDNLLNTDMEFNSLFLEITAMSVRNPVIRKSFSEKTMFGLQVATCGIASQQHQGLVRKNADPRTLAMAILSIFDGLRILALTGVDRDELRRRWIEIGKILLQTKEELKPQLSAISTDDCACMTQMKCRMNNLNNGESFAIPDCPDDCPIKDCKVRHGKVH
ncbi:MAG: TetR/AcrR family transcriptional regulator [Methanoregula sp.]|jgi:AcrR family transcriptional regulator